ncbi:Predicted membrane protein [Algoriphagus winogradskyi]|uniref:Predicted membrane protein n=2 Tax=Algoriphagus winogradskyi TaxID=237017 RepID=A0ABY1NYV8_9BACT|nr:Predicted membrane protein [Algoriphagus winogradskyi]
MSISMKKIAFLFLLFFAQLEAFSQDFSVTSYSVDITIHEEGYFDVVEKYNLNFEVPKHGIFRDIQLAYDLQTEEGELEKRQLKLSQIEVPGYKFDAPSAFGQKYSDNARIKIGDANVTLEGPQQYEIRYRVENAFLFESEAIQFYWNIKPSDWYAPFNKIDFQVHLPNGVSLQKDDYFLYSGTIGSNVPTNDFETSYANGIYSGSSKEGIVSSGGEAVTVLLKLPLRSIKEIKPLWPFWTDYGWTLILPFVYFGFYSIWKKHGKDDHVTTTTSYYPPPGMDPAMVGFLIDDSGDTVDLISLIPFWASHGYLTIEEIDEKGWFAKDDTKLTKLKEIEADAPLYQRQLFNGLFASKTEVLVSSLKEKFYTTMSTANGSLKDAAQLYYVNKSRKIKNYTIIGLILLMFILVPVFLFFWGILAAIAMGVSGLFLLIMSQFLIKKNKEGTMILSELKGFKQFIKVAEENKLKMLLQEDPTYFETTMSYALAFGMFDKWAKKFEGLNLQPPTWYYSSTGRMMTMNHFSKSFNNSIKSTQSSMVSSPSSSGGSGGGGSSGGGFGGGGGGSW